MSNGSTRDLTAAARRASWRKSSFSGYDGECVTVAALPGGIGVRDSKQPEAGTLVLSREQFAGWVASIRAGEFDDLT